LQRGYGFYGFTIESQKLKATDHVIPKVINAEKDYENALARINGLMEDCVIICHARGGGHPVRCKIQQFQNLDSRLRGNDGAFPNCDTVSNGGG